MSTSARTIPSRSVTFLSSVLPPQVFIALLLTYCLLLQILAPPALATPQAGYSFAWLDKGVSSVAALFKSPKVNQPPPNPAAALVIPAPEEFGVVLTPVTTAFTGHIGIEHHQPLRKLVVSANNPTGMPGNFESLDADGTHRPVLERSRPDRWTEDRDRA